MSRKWMGSQKSGELKVGWEPEVGGEPKVNGEPEVDGEPGADAARTIIWPSTIIRHHPRWHARTLCIYPATSGARMI